MRALSLVAAGDARIVEVPDTQKQSAIYCSGLKWWVSVALT
jgi:hypothetical protein